MNSDLRFFSYLAKNARKHATQARKATRKALAAGKTELAKKHAESVDFWTRRRLERLAVIVAIKAELAS